MVGYDLGADARLARVTMATEGARRIVPDPPSITIAIQSKKGTVPRFWWRLRSYPKPIKFIGDLEAGRGYYKNTDADYL